MGNAAFPKPVGEIVSTLADIFRHQRRAEIVELLENSHAWLDNTDFDNWNGGTYTWTLRLEVPIPIFASVEPRLGEIEKEIGSKLGHFSRLYPNDPLSDATVTPISPGVAILGQRIAPSETEVGRLWPENRFRLFISHVSAHKVAVSKLKDELESHAVCGFVAHEAITPSLEWQHEIELALRSMHALIALITPDFHGSNWTDQEIGWALGRGILVVPVRLGIDPYGFIGKVQGVTGRLESPGTLAAAIVESLLVNPQTHGEMRRSLVRAFCDANSYSRALGLRNLIVKAADFTEEEKAMLWDACEINPQVSGAYQVPATIYKAIGKPPTKAKIPPNTDDEVPF